MYKGCLMIFSLLLFMSCKQHVCKWNPVFDKNSFSSQTYKAELVRRLQGADLSKFDYYISDYTEDSNKQYLEIAMHSDQFCAVAIMDITDCARLDGVKEHKGMSYHGAGISGLKFRIDSSNGTYTFIAEDLKHIID